MAARERQAARLAGPGAACNAEMTPRMLRELVGATPSALRLLYELHDRNGLSARGHGRVLRVARTVADLAGQRRVDPGTSPEPRLRRAPRTAVARRPRARPHESPATSLPAGGRPPDRGDC